MSCRVPAHSIIVGGRITVQSAAVLRLMLADPTRAYYGLQIVEQTHLPTGTIYPLLRRLEKAGWIASTWEEREPSELKRPRRRLYRFTGAGAHAARGALADVHQFLTLAPDPAPEQLATPEQNMSSPRHNEEPGRHS